MMNRTERRGAASAARNSRESRAQQRNAVFRAIADPTRRQILGLLRGGPQTVGEIARNFRMSRPAVSKHLRQLRRAGLIVTRQEGTSTRCGLNARPLRGVNEWLEDYRNFWRVTLRGLRDYIEERR
ncbi:MAG TPA: metalloregulator ArsR/SmtB family transcription factor [Verrucomicrobiae bacterium]|nr:metalloregulator ArsR/SmtB family transcription factor [Verrucomicrobiae bacterium]